MDVLPASPLKSTPMISEQETRSGPCSVCATDSDRAIAQLLRALAACVTDAFALLGRFQLTWLQDSLWTGFNGW